MIELQLLRKSLHHHLLEANTTLHLRLLSVFSILANPRSKILPKNCPIYQMAEPSTLIPNLSEIMEEYTQPRGEVHLKPSRENGPSEQPEVQPISKQQRKMGKEKQQEGEEDEFVSEEAFSIWKKYYAGKGFVGERGFIKLISPFKELI